MKGLDKVGMEYQGKTVDITKPLNAIQNQTAIVVEAKAQLANLFENWIDEIHRAFKDNGNELKVGLSVNLKGDSKGVHVKTTISFIAEKITDELEGNVIYGQEKLPI